MEILGMVGDIVRAQASHAGMTSDDMAEAIKKVYKALKWAQVQEEKSAQAAEEPKMSGPESIQRNKVICLECGKVFKVLTGKHLVSHGLDQREYKTKFGIPRTMALSARSLSALRRKVAKEKGLGERLKKARVAKEKGLGERLQAGRKKATKKSTRRQRKTPAAPTSKA